MAQELLIYCALPLVPVVFNETIYLTLRRLVLRVRV